MVKPKQRPQVARLVEERMLSDLRAYVEYFSEATGMAISGISANSVKDPTFLGLVLKGTRQLTPRKYEAVIGYMEGVLDEPDALTEAMKARRPRVTPASVCVDDLVSLLCDDALVADLPAFVERNGPDAAKALTMALTVFCGEVVKLIPLPEEQEHAAA